MSPSRSSAGIAIPLAIAAVALVAAVAFGAASLGASPSPSPAPSATPAPTPVITAAPSDPASPAPSQDADRAEIRLDSALGHDVVVAITDRNDLLTEARSGTAKDGMSARWGTASVRNLDPNTVEVSWAGYPQDEIVGLLVVPTSDGVLLRIGQSMPYPNTDVMGADRVLVLTFAEAVSADDVAAEFTTADD
jgi:hypothetical protein